MRAIKTLQS